MKMGSPLKKSFADAKLDASPLKKSAPKARRDDPSGALHFSPVMIARQRLQSLKRFNQLRKTVGNKRAAKIVGSSVTTIWRWRKQVGRGLRGLYPKPASGGRAARFALVKIPVAGQRELERLFAQGLTINAAWRQFANHPLCPPTVSRYVATHGKAPAPLAYVGRLIPVQAESFLSADGRRVWIRIATDTSFPVSAALPSNLTVERSAFAHHSRVIQTTKRAPRSIAESCNGLKTRLT